MNEKLITVGIPVYNGEKFIAQTLESIINQTYKNIEIIISDNKSIDNTTNIVREFMSKDRRIKLNINSVNLGFSGNLNKIIELANSEYIAIYHADDVYEPTIVEEQVKFLEANKELAGCFTLAKVINEKGENKKSIFVYNAKNMRKDLIINLDFFINKLANENNIFICPTSMIKKSVYVDLGGYDSSLKFIEDQDMWLRILLKNKLGIIAKELVKYRVHQGQGSNYYTNPLREEISVSVKNLEEFIKINLNYDGYRDKINKMYARDYCLIALINLKKCLIEKSLEFSNKSKDYYRFRINEKFWLIQNVNHALLCFIIKLIKGKGF